MFKWCYRIIIILTVLEMHGASNVLVNFIVDNQTGKKIFIENSRRKNASIIGDTDLCFVSELFYQLKGNCYHSFFRVKEMNPFGCDQIFRVYIPDIVLKKALHQANHEFASINIEFILYKKKGIFSFLPECYKLSTKISSISIQ